jgi:hypothetical protein
VLAIGADSVVQGCGLIVNLRNITAMAEHSDDSLAWARRGAEVRWNELQVEAVSLLKAFPIEPISEVPESE